MAVAWLRGRAAWSKFSGPMSGPETLYLRDGLGQLAARLGELGTKRVLVLAPPSRRYVDEVTRRARAVLADRVRRRARARAGRGRRGRGRRGWRESGADTIVAIGGGSAIGLGKALRLAHDVKFAAVPATYAGSEMTTMYGITHGARQADRPRSRACAPTSCSTTSR